MAISSNTIFHFTNSVDHLTNILKFTFQPHYCLEDFQEIFISHEKLKKIGIPMVSFCDLPLSNVKEHLKCYGQYGIGMKKEWGLKKGLNPVMYVCPHSELAGHFDNFLKSLLERGGNATKKEWNDFYEIASLIKRYKGTMEKSGKRYHNKIFYNEREWRYVPRVKFSSEELYRLTEGEFLDEKNRILASEDLGARYRLSFEPNDIKYIIVEKEEQILDMINSIEAIKAKYDADRRRLLASRVISTKQILEDF